eukprot:TRINITY_DN2240_c0_g1_i2.p1 TRINITY_DN2240_c0_g1~~TRINITY_DN2240_c0_g1_i2.p1  ORF type:complete len:362 (-),score=87.51 TRINITY_DN2240_c0_g1_i2:21-1106(-)
MSLASLLLQKNTELVQVQTKEHQPDLTQRLCNTSEEYMALMKETYFEAYYDRIQPFTFQSELFRLDTTIAEALRRCHRNQYAKDHSLHVEGADWTNDPDLLLLATQIDEAQTKLGCEGLFIRLSSRSPKDAALSDKGRDIYHESMTKLADIDHGLGIENPDIQNRKVHALYIAGTKALRALNGHECVHLLVQSDRIQADIDEALANPEEEFNVVVREFADFEVELELRAFVYNGKVTSVTQYNEYCFFPRLLKNRELISNVIKEFVNGDFVKLVGIEHFVLDLILISDTPDEGPYSNLRLWVVEVNPFAEFAGAGMFSWEVKEDKEVLMGKREFEFRLKEDYPVNALNSIAGEWKDFVLQN